MHTTPRIATIAIPALAAVLAASCRQTDASAEPARTETVSQAAGDVALPRTDGLQLVVAPDGNEVRYRVREQLVGVDLPNDAVGSTNAVSGAIAFDAAGKIVPASSRFVVTASTLESDRERRDGYVRGRLLETSEYPTVELAPTALQGLTLPIPSHGTKSFTLLGNLTVHGVTKPTTWQVNASFADGRVTGTARTAFTFSEFGLTQPRVPVVLSVADTIGLEYTFALVPKR